jgi:beta-lactamase superfamily II metal-dependent hydrolase
MATAKKKAAKRATSATKRITPSAKKTAARGMRAATSPRSTAAQRNDQPSTGRVQIRMYRQGLGDFFLVTLPKKDGSPFRILIDCGVIAGTPNAKQEMQRLVAQMKQDVQNRLDVVVVTHRHADHVSGFLQAQDIFEDPALKIGEVWVSWVEDPRDKLGKQLLATHAKAEQALRMSATRLQGLGVAAGDEIASLLDFRGEMLGATGGSTTTAAVEIAKKLGAKEGSSLRYCRPADPPIELEGTDAKVYVFGPPPDLTLLGKMNPSTKDPQTYGMTALQSLMRDISPALGLSGSDGATGNGAPFGATWTIDLDAAKVPQFFRDTYYDEASAWRKIDSDWLQGTSALALAFDQAVNNTSLVLAIELGDGDVLLFAADAQVGNWLSWQALTWKGDKDAVKTLDLLKRVVFYKVGHHASHNATLEAQGLELMEKIAYAMISVDAKMALKKRWGQMPFPPLLQALDQHTNQRTLRADQPIPAATTSAVVGNDDYYELTL